MTAPTQRQHGDSAMTGDGSINNYIMRQWLLELMSDHDFIVSVAAFDELVEALTPPAPRPDGLAVACYRLQTANRNKWQWMDGKPSLGAIDEAALHGWSIEYAYTRTTAQGEGKDHG